MSGKVKMRCARCGKQFKSASAKQTLCTDCEIKERQARAVSKAQGPKPAAPAPVAHPHQPKIVGPGAGILVPGMAPAAPPAEHGQMAHGVGAVQAEHTTHQHPPAGTSTPSARPPHERHEKHEHQEKHGKHERQVATHPQPARQAKSAAQPRQRKPPVPPFVLTDEMRAQIEQRYLELAQPVEFDGIRTRISEELGIPKAAVRHVVQEVRTRLQMPSWWELQAFNGSDDDLARIRAAYEPLLPVPPVGIHKQLATTLGLDQIAVYHGIHRIRAEMRLPQYNPPELHAEPEDSHSEASPSQTASSSSSTHSDQPITPATTS